MLDKFIEYSEFIKVRLSIVIILPFWYLILYLFDNNFYTKSDLILKVIVCFCITLPAELIHSVGTHLYNDRYKRELKDVETTSVVNLTLWVSILIIINYTCKKYIGLYTSVYFLILYFHALPLLLTAILLCGGKIREKETK